MSLLRLDHVVIAVADLDGTVARLADAGVRVSKMGGRVRLVTHADVTDADIAAALERIGPVEPTRSPGVRVRMPAAPAPAPARPAGH